MHLSLHAILNQHVELLIWMCVLLSSLPLSNELESFSFQLQMGITSCETRIMGKAISCVFFIHIVRSLESCARNPGDYNICTIRPSPTCGSFAPSPN